MNIASVNWLSMIVVVVHTLLASYLALHLTQLFQFARNPNNNCARGRAWYEATCIAVAYTQTQMFAVNTKTIL